MASRRAFTALALGALGALSACGQKGPLYFPEDVIEKHEDTIEKKKEKVENAALPDASGPRPESRADA